MRHRRKINHLSRKSGHRKAMLANMAASLIMHKKIETTTAKAKALRSYIEPLITKSKEDTTHSRRTVFGYLQDKQAVTELFREVSAKIGDRPGGYTRILKTGTRLGDSADMCIIELVDYNENLLAAKAESTQTTGRRRRRRGGQKKTGELASETTEVSTDVNTEVTSLQEPNEDVTDEAKNDGGETDISVDSKEIQDAEQEDSSKDASEALNDEDKKESSASKISKEKEENIETKTEIKEEAKPEKKSEDNKDQPQNTAKEQTDNVSEDDNEKKGKEE